MVGEDIPIGARILAAVDCLDALASHRQYRPAIPLDQAMRTVKEKSGIWFDPKIVTLLERRYVDLERMAQTHEAGFIPAGFSKDLRVERGLRQQRDLKDRKRCLLVNLISSPRSLPPGKRRKPCSI